MKRSRIFLGATSALLAIAGVAAAKMAHFSSTTTRYYCTHIAAVGGRICVPYAFVNCQSQESGTITCYFTVLPGMSPNYTLYSNGVAKGTHHCNVSGSCTAKVLYATFE
jgi:hypothetical protein